MGNDRIYNPWAKVLAKHRKHNQNGRKWPLWKRYWRLGLPDNNTKKSKCRKKVHGDFWSTRTVGKIDTSLYLWGIACLAAGFISELLSSYQGSSLAASETHHALIISCGSSILPNSEHTSTMALLAILAVFLMFHRPIASEIDPPVCLCLVKSPHTYVIPRCTKSFLVLSLVLLGQNITLCR